MGLDPVLVRTEQSSLISSSGIQPTYYSSDDRCIITRTLRSAEKHLHDETCLSYKGDGKGGGLDGDEPQLLFSCADRISGVGCLDGEFFALQFCITEPFYFVTYF
jgi:hypothetical protein